MHLKRLTLRGFKSFANATTFEFEPGVTAVVGPNGSGKSNVVDALAWVMGEQGAKTLRGGKMEDVIFAGTSTRGPLGRAEVSLTIDNSDGQLPIEYAEVTISRTLFRNGGSEYAINGDTCRLLDVQELLSDSGLGREMHVIVGQGRLDTVLRATPEERRGFIEEAAGILKHRRRKEKTLRKLDAMEGNLTRLSDLAAEVRRQLKPLGRQAEVARRAQTIAADVRDAHARLLADELATLRGTLAQLTEPEHQLSSERTVLTEQLEHTQLRSARLEQHQMQTGAAEERATANALEMVQERARGLYTLANQRLALLTSQTGHPLMAANLSADDVAEAREVMYDLADAVPTAEEQYERAAEQTAAAARALNAIDEELRAHNELVARIELERSGLAGQYESALSRQHAVEEQLARLTELHQAAEARAATAAQALSAFETAHTEHPGDETGLDRDYQEQQRLLSEAERARDDVREHLHALEQRRASLAATATALGSALDVQDAGSELLHSQTAGLEGRVLDHVQVAPGYERAIAAALGALGDALLTRDQAAAIAALTHASARELGIVSLVTAEPPVEPPAEPAGAVATDDACRASTQLVDAVAATMHRLAQAHRIAVTPAGQVVTAPLGVTAQLAGVFLVETLDDAQTLQRELGAAGSTVTLITRDGVLLRGSLLRGGSGEGPSRIELTRDRDQAAAELAETVTQIALARAQLDAHNEQATSSKRRAQEALTVLREHDAQTALTAQQRNRLRVQAEASAGEAERLSAQRAEATRQLDAARAATDTAERALAAAAAVPATMRDVSERDQLSNHLDRARAAELDARLTVETVKQRLAAATTHAQTLATQYAAEQQALAEAARAAALRDEHIARAQAVVDALPALLDSIARSVDEAHEARRAAEARHAAYRQELTELRETEAGLRERLRLITDELHGIELAMYEQKLGVSVALERAGSELGFDEHVLMAEYGPDVAVALADGTSIPFNRSEQQSRLKRAQRALAELGKVNPLALEEFAALEQRHQFLTDQLRDLTKTRADLLTIIGELDEKMEYIFSSAFADTRAAFADVFPVLFPGGTGDIFLTDPQDLLRTGIEVRVRPMGKKIERLSLLSGGERSLAAVALLIAIFRARPSPFYIMDEVEAALDDANLGRLLTIFETLRERSQLIVITHQKRTMEIADALYGVSMRQDGVSAVLGQRIRERGGAA